MKTKQIVEFVECKENLGRLQLWVQNSIIYCKCRQCGETTSCMDTRNNHKTHFNHYRIEIKRNRKESWDEYWDRAEKEVLLDPSRYFYFIPS